MPVDPKRLTDLLALSHIPRWSIVPRLKEQSVSDHVFRVLVIALEIYARLSLEMPAIVWLWVLTHDADESRTGDIPTPAKEFLNYPEIGTFCTWLAPLRLDPEDRMLTKLADLVEAYTWIAINGTGHHADFVSDRMREEIDDTMADADDPGQLNTVIKTIINDIAGDVGRLQG